MNIDRRLDNDCLILILYGRIDAGNAHEANEKIELLTVGVQAEVLIIDVNELEYISSAGLRIILSLVRRYKNVHVRNASDDIYKIFYSTGMADIIDMD